MAPDVTVPLDDLIQSDAPSAMRDFMRYWSERRGDALMPAYGDIDPVDIPWALARIHIVKRLPDDDFVYRLAGEVIAQRYDRSLKGLRISDLFNKQSADQILGRWRRVVAGPSACYTYTQHTSVWDATVRARRLLLPLGEDRRTADHIIGFTMFDEGSDYLEQFTDGMVLKAVRWADLTA